MSTDTAPAKTKNKAAPMAPVASPVAPAVAVAEVAPVAVAAAVETAVDTTHDLRAAAERAAPSSKDQTMTDTIKNVAENITAKGEQVFAEAKSRTEDVVSKGKAMFADAGEFGKGNVEALVESGRIAAKGFERLGQEQAEFVRRSFEQSTAAFKSLSGVKSPTEFAKLQSDYVRQAFDAMVAQTSHQTEAMLKLAGEIAQPLSNRFAVAAEKVKLAA